MQETEFVALGVGENVEALVAALADVGSASAEAKESFEFGDRVACSQIDVTPQLGGFGDAPTWSHIVGNIPTLPILDAAYASG